MSKVLWTVLALVCAAGSIFGLVMTVMAFRFMEYGRVVFYLVITIGCIELAILSLMKSKHKES